MTKRKATPKTTPTINSTAPKQAVESVKGKTNTVVVPTATKAVQKPTGKPRGRPKKAIPIAVQNGKGDKVVLVDPNTITYPDMKVLVAVPPTLIARFKAWLVYKLYYVTSFFRGY